MEGLLKCPHGLVTGCEERQGLMWNLHKIRLNKEIIYESGYH